MPWLYVVAHGVSALAAGLVTLAVARRRRRVALAIAVAALALGVPLQLVVRGRPHLLAQATCWPDVIHFAAAWLQLAVVLAVAAVLAQPTEPRAVRWRTGALGAVAVAAALFAMPWRRPPVERLGRPYVDADGIVRQTLPTTCGAAAAATLLRALRVEPDASEGELARRCLTDPRLGTTELGLFRGLAVSAPGREVRYRSLDLDGLRRLGQPAVILVNLERGRVADPELYRLLRDECGWIEDVPHAVVWYGTERGRPGEQPEVARIGDPRNGLERWGMNHFEALWTGLVLTVE